MSFNPASGQDAPSDSICLECGEDRRFHTDSGMAYGLVCRTRTRDQTTAHSCNGNWVYRCGNPAHAAYPERSDMQEAWEHGWAAGFSAGIREKRAPTPTSTMLNAFGLRPTDESSDE